MPFPDIPQPETIPITDWLRLRRYDGDYGRFLPGYQDPVVCRDSEGILDEGRKPDLDYVSRMCGYLSRVGEMYYIEALEDGSFVPIGDVTLKEENLPIAIWWDRYRGSGIGTLVMETAIRRMQTLGFTGIRGSTVYRWNLASRKMHEKLGFRCIAESGDEIIYELKFGDRPGGRG